MSFVDEISACIIINEFIIYLFVIIYLFMYLFIYGIDDGVFVRNLLQCIIIKSCNALQELETDVVNTCGLCESICREDEIPVHPCLKSFPAYYIDKNTRYFYPQYGKYFTVKRILCIKLCINCCWKLVIRVLVLQCFRMRRGWKHTSKKPGRR